VAKKRKRVEWTPGLVTELRKHSKSRTRVSKLQKLFKRTEGALRQKARLLGIPLGHRVRSKKR
jgi:hypothetical protein